MDVSGFDWDEGNRDKCQKHGVSIAEIEDVLSGTPRVVPDLEHSDAEERFIAVGRTLDDRPIFVAFAFRMCGDRRLIRPISARYMHLKEHQAYGAQSSETDE